MVKNIEQIDNNLIIYNLKIPKERLAVLIGRNGETKKQIENLTDTVIQVNSKEGDITIKGEDGLKLYSAKQIIVAIGRGFNPDIASLLTKPDYMFKIININDYSKTKKSIKRLKGRVIGKKGKCRRYIEKMTGCYICVYGKTVSIIGRIDTIMDSTKAIEDLLRGAQHATVYHFLERRRRQLKYHLLDTKYREDVI